jgi:hypothetical protein
MAPVAPGRRPSWRHRLGWRLLGLGVAILLTLFYALPALAHGFDLIADVSVSGGAVTVQLMDPYGAQVSGLTVTAATGAPGKKPGPETALTEGPQGTYKGQIQPPSGPAELTIVARMGPDQFRGRLPLEPGKEYAQVEVRLLHVEPETGFSWAPYLYLGAVIILVTASAYVLLKKREDDGGEEE